MTPPDTRNPWITRSSREVYRNPWIRVREDDVLKPNGSPGIYGVVEYLNRAVGVVPIDDEGHTWLVGQYRYTQQQYEWEIPEGGCPQGESLEDCARRELLEETGLLADLIEPLACGLQLSNSVSNETAHLFIARQLHQQTPQPDDTEQLAVRRLPLTQAIEMAASGEIRDAMSVIALLLIERSLHRPQEKSG
jgi:8-oxo-dGTP pyrophosphatase MutT (NUDIX family)